jgi:hypothetical protein
MRLADASQTLAVKVLPEAEEALAAAEPAGVAEGVEAMAGIRG